MKYATVLNRFVIICVFVVSILRSIGSERLPVDVETSKNAGDCPGGIDIKKMYKVTFNVMKTTEELMGYRKYIFSHMCTKKKHYERVSMKLIRGRIREKLEDLSNLIRIASKSGLNFTECYTSTETNMTWHLKELRRANCDATDMAPINKFVHRINETMKVEDKILYKLSKVIFNCGSTNCTQFQQCMNNSIDNIKGSAIDYRRSFKAFKLEGISLKNDHSNFQCFGQRAGKILSMELENIYRNGTLCVIKLNAH